MVWLDTVYQILLKYCCSISPVFCVVHRFVICVKIDDVASSCINEGVERVEDHISRDAKQKRSEDFDILNP